jgi:hypothetical protein
MFIRQLLFFTFLASLFFIELCLTSFFYEPFLYLSIGVYYHMLMTRMSWLNLLSMWLLLSLLSFIYYGRIGAFLLLIIPGTFLFFKLEKIMHKPRLAVLILVAGTILIHSTILEPYLWASHVSALYTGRKIIANIMVLLLMH